ncbi:MAG: efflux RND transporter permease subunit [Brevundimonas sp.]|jgi:multidrug efflux pump subunit AcrB|uniref:efflux RND transporter permease subunit n=1 Tax=Brevundimonas sp. TaxID=1871086 RepID=UPI0025BFA56B|nr:efflux RND transporter permease subunit [Brevundimonas sp.]MCH4267347.1 efflux RND transporter permease subunit [Brevundimonas sp.]
MNLGLSGRLTAAFIRSPLTPLILLAALAMGLLAVMSIPREEEPQISVPMIDIIAPTPGLAAPDAVELVGKPLEGIVKAIPDVEHVYTFADDDQVMVVARFKVGTHPDNAVVRVHEKLRANMDRLPEGVPEPIVKAKGINDVPMLTLTLSPDVTRQDRWDEATLRTIADQLQTEVVKVEDVGQTFIVGGQPEEIRIEPDPARLSLNGVSLGALMDTVRQANRAFPGGYVRESGQARSVIAGRSLASVSDIELLEIPTAGGGVVTVRDVARVVRGPADDQSRVSRWSTDDKGRWTQTPAVTLAISKREGANAVVVAEAVLHRIESLKGTLIPDGLHVAVTRDYGETANEKANELLFHLALATATIVVLIGFAIGWREAAVTAVVIPTTILLTLFASNLMGYTINRVSLFALIFSIGILVDDAIVVIENIARHWAMKDDRPRVQAAIEAVAEVGNPTVVATLTVVAALLPMLFVSGLMGPYMAPIPVNASAAMIFSFFVAMIIAPWLMVRFARKALADGHAAHSHDEGWMGRAYRRIAGRVIATRKSAWTFLIVVGIATLLAMSMFYFKAVTVKLLPFDNKSELMMVADLPEGAALETTERILTQAATVARQLPEVQAIDSYAGTASPFNFNGLVRHYYMRSQPEQGDLTIILAPKGERKRASHAIALDLRERLGRLALPEGTTLKVVEAPPGPPVMATLLAEVYGPDAATRRAVAEKLKGIFHSVPYIVDIDDSYGAPRPRLRLTPDRAQIERFGASERDVLDSIGALMGGQTVGYVHRGEGRDPLAINVTLPQSGRAWSEALGSTPVAASASGGRLVSLGELVTASREPGSTHIYRRDGRDVDMVMAELAGEYEAPIYGMLAVDRKVKAADWGDLPTPEIRLNGQPEDESRPTILWDGEWEITWVTFRDMGAAFGVAILGIYVLVVAQFKSFRLPLVILTPIPLTLVGIVIGHILFRAPFTATSMIGFIALAGIIVRNSILLVDFIRHTEGKDRSLRGVLLEAGAIRFKPILLTALAAMIGAAVILFDPIFQGLAISLLFGLASSTLLTVLVIPAIYVVLRDDQPA